MNIGKSISTQIAAHNALATGVHGVGANSIISNVQAILKADLDKRSLVNLLTNGDFEVGDPPTGWTLTGAGATFARSAVQKKIGSYSGLLTRVGNNCYVVRTTTSSTYYQGRVFTAGCWVYATVANRARIYLWDTVSGVASAYHSGVPGWEWLTATYTPSSSPTSLFVHGQVNTGNTAAYFDGAMLVEGDSCPAFSPKPATYEERVPSGAIMMWHGTLANIPAGWALCDGTAGTPDLLARFVEGVATAATDPGVTGGALNKTTAGHKHTIQDTPNEGAHALDGSDSITTVTDTIADIRPPFYDVAFIMKL